MHSSAEFLKENGHRLGILQRALLVTDGTVTNLLEVYVDEPVRVVKLDQHFEAIPSDQVDRRPVGGTVLLRTVLLQGVHSRRNVLYAHSILTVDRLDPGIVDGLVHTDRPVGRLLAEYRVETFREIVAFGFEPAGTCAEYFDVETNDTLVFRTYRVVVDKQPAMQITEKFPLTLFRDG
jgi:chorismate-pyruvate lyase